MFSKMVILIPVYNPRERIINYVKKLKEKNYDVVYDVGKLMKLSRCF